VFYRHKIVRRRNLRKLLIKITDVLNEYEAGTVEAVDVLEKLQGWNAYAMHGNTYHLRQRLMEGVEQELIRRTPSRHT
jgi:uncharacterized protein YydD (DUF2326 family)